MEKYIGDAVMAVWGTPVTHEDDAERAVRGGLELVDAVTAMGSRAGVAGLHARAASSPARRDDPGAGHQGMVTGDMVNTAARLQSSADPGSVFVGDATHRAAADAIASNRRGPSP